MRIVCMVSLRRHAPTMAGLTLIMYVLGRGERSGLCVTLTIESTLLGVIVGVSIYNLHKF